MQETVIERFMKFVSPEPTTGCWLWTGVVTVRIPRPSLLGYGRFTICGFKHVAHRASWLIFKGRIPDGMCVCHKCDTSLCVNPEHLFLGTYADNVRDAMAKGRHVISSPRKLTDAQYEAIRNAIGSQRQIAKQFNISQTHVGKIKRTNANHHF
jgi:hypothetical protein